MADDVPTPSVLDTRSWAPLLGADSLGTLSEFQKGLPVRLIATPRTAFETCSPNEPLSSVIERNTDDFDYFPVVESGGGTRERIIGLLHVAPFMDTRECGDLVQDRMDSLSEDNLIGADASLLGFVRSADQQGCRLIVSGPEISGLVTRSDLQRLPVRASLFALVTHLEMTMSDSIRREFPNGDGWLDRLSECRRANVIREESKSKSADSFVDTLLFTQFADKRDIIRRSSLFSGSKSSYDRDMKQIRSLRDHLAHANDYARTRVMQIDVSKTVRLTESWIERLANFPAN